MSSSRTTRDASVARPERGSIRVEVFGGLRLFRDEVEVELGPPRQRSLFAALVAARGETVALSQLTAVLWEGETPGSAANQVQRFAGNLRRVLQPELGTRAVGDYLTARGSGYVLDLRGVESDLERFFEMVERSSKAQDHAAQQESAFRALRIAALPAFIGLDPELLASPAFVAIDQTRRALCSVVVASVRNDKSRLGEVFSTVERMADGDPLDESLQANLIRLLHLAGRRADAFEAYEKTRMQLSESLGIDPGTDLRAAYLELLSDAEEPAPPDQPDVPRELPPPVMGFVRREALRAQMDEATAQAVQGGGGVAVISGMGGLGKTALAVHWASEVADQFPDGQLYLNLLGFDSNRLPLSPEEGVTRLLEQLGSQRVNQGSAERLSSYRSLMHTKKVVMVLDNARDADQVRPFLSGAPGCLTIVTSRNRLAGLVVREGARAIALTRLDDAESRQFLAARLGTDKPLTKATAINSLIASCSGLPLALAIAAARAALAPESEMNAMAARLASRAGALDSLIADDDNDIRSTFEWSYRVLDPEAARMFRHLAAHPGPGMSIHSLASIADRPLAESRRLIASLAAASMVTEVDGDMIEVHDLLRAYASELLDAHHERASAEQRLIEHYVRSTRAAFLQFGRAPTVELGLGPTLWDSLEDFAGFEDSLLWYVRERAALVGAIRKAVDLGMDREAALIALDWRPMNGTLDSSADSLDTVRIAFDASVRSNDVVLMADLARDYGTKLAGVGDFASAQRLMLQSLRAFESVGDLAGVVNAYRNLSLNASLHGALEEEREFAERAVAAARGSGRADILALALSQLGQALRHAGGREAELIEVAREELIHARTAGLDYLVPYAGLTLADTLYAQGDYAAAYREALLVFSHPMTTSDVSLLAGSWGAQAMAASRLGQRETTREALANYDRTVNLNPALIEEKTTQDSADFIREVRYAREWLASADGTA